MNEQLKAQLSTAYVRWRGQEPCDRAEIVVRRLEHWVPKDRQEELRAHIRVALDAEVRAGGPYMDNGWNKV